MISRYPTDKIHVSAGVHFIHWIAIYPLNKVIRSLNKWRLVYCSFLFFFSVTDYEAVVKLSDGFNGADLRNVCTEAGLCTIIPMVLRYIPVPIHSDFIL